MLENMQLASSMFMILLFFTMITHGGLFSPYGLVPLALLLSLQKVITYTKNKIEIE